MQGPQSEILKYNDDVVYAYKRRKIGKNLPIGAWVRLIGKNLVEKVFSPIELLIDTKTDYVRFKIDPNLKDKKWYLKLKKDIADSLGWDNLRLRYGGKELDQWTLDEIQNIPRYSIDITRDDTLGKIDDSQFELERKKEVERDASEKEIDEREKLMTDILTRLFMDKTKDMSLEELVKFITDRNKVLPEVIRTIRNPICYDSNQKDAYANFMKKYKVNISHLCDDITQKLIQCGCNSGYKNKKKKKRRNRIYPVVSIGSHLSEKNQELREELKQTEIKNLLINCGMLDSIRCAWDNVWKRCKCDCKKKCRCKKRCICKGRCRCKRAICNKNLKCYRNENSSSSSSCSSDSDKSSSSDEEVNKYTRAGYLAVTNPYKKYYHYSHVEKKQKRYDSSSSDSDDDFKSSSINEELSNNIFESDISYDISKNNDNENNNQENDVFSFSINSNTYNDSSNEIFSFGSKESLNSISRDENEELHNFTSPHGYKDDITFISSDIKPSKSLYKQHDNIPELIKISANENEECDVLMAGKKPIVKPISFDVSTNNYNIKDNTSYNYPLVEPIEEFITNDDNSDDSDDDIYISNELNEIINKYKKNKIQKNANNVSFEEIKDKGSNFMKIMDSMDMNFNESKKYKLFVPSNKSLTNSTTNSIMKKSNEFKSRFLHNHISDDMTETNLYMENYKTLGGKVFPYNSKDNTIDGNKSKYTVHGISEDPSNKNLLLILQDGLYNDMPSNI
jgi:hypothetical protein